jgi:LytR cell envelope-related transcriptional attenuator
VDHPLSPTELVRPWRTATIVLTGIAAIQLILLIGAGIILLGRQIAPHVHKAAAREAAAKPAKASPPTTKHKPKATRTLAARAKPPLPRAKTKVLVLNGNGVQGAAALAAQLAQARGYPVLDVGNATKTGYARTIVMYRPGFRSEALRFRHDLNLSVVAPIDGMTPAELKGAQLVEILGAAR